MNLITIEYLLYKRSNQQSLTFYKVHQQSISPKPGASLLIQKQNTQAKKDSMSEQDLSRMNVVKDKQHRLKRQTEEYLANPDKKRHRQRSSQNSDDSENYSCKESCMSWFTARRVKNLIFAWLLFMAAFLIYIIIWIINFYGTKTLRSPYYLTSGFKVSPYTSIEYWNTSDIATGSTTTTFSESTTLYANKDDLNTAGSVALSLFYSWLMWKLPLCVYSLHIIQKSRQVENDDQSKPRVFVYSTFGCFLLLILVIDVILAILKIDTLYDWIFYCIYVFLSLALILLNVYHKKKSEIFQTIFKDFVLPISYVAVTIVSFGFFIPSIYFEIYDSAPNSAAIIIVHIFPLIDLFFYLLLYYMSKITTPNVTAPLIKMLHFLNLGYAVGTWLLVGVEEVEYYYLLAYFVFRNFTMNWMQSDTYKHLYNSPILPAWIVVYLISLRLNFVPLVAVGNLVVSKSFQTHLLAFTLPILRYVVSGQYYVYSATSRGFSELNDSMESNIQLFSPFIIWAVLTFTQRYQIVRISKREIFFYTLGIYLFYIGLVSGLQLYYLKEASLAA